MSVSSQFRTGIKSVQRGVATPSATGGATTTVTISAVNTAKSVVIANNANGETNAPSSVVASASLTSSTQITITQGWPGGGSISNPGRVAWQVLEFY